MSLFLHKSQGNKVSCFYPRGMKNSFSHAVVVKGISSSCIFFFNIYYILHVVTIFSTCIFFNIYYILHARLVFFLTVITYYKLESYFFFFWLPDFRWTFMQFQNQLRSCRHCVLQGQPMRYHVNWQLICQPDGP